MNGRLPDRTEANWRDGIAQDEHFAFSETPAYIGRAVAALASDPSTHFKQDVLPNLAKIMAELARS